MSFAMTNFAKELLLSGGPEGRDPRGNPFSTPGEVKFDSFRLEPVNDVLGGYRMVLVFAGIDVLTQDIPNFQQGMVLTVIGIEGSIGLFTTAPEPSPNLAEPSAY